MRKMSKFSERNCYVARTDFRFCYWMVVKLFRERFFIEVVLNDWKGGRNLKFWRFDDRRESLWNLYRTR